MSGADVVPRWSAQLERAVIDYALPGLSAAVVVREGQTVWSDGRGWADRNSARPVRPDTLFRVGSITKLFTATAVMILRDEGRLSLDDPVAAHVPEFPGPAVTIRHLLCHGAGLQRESPDEAGWRTRAFGPDEKVRAALPRSNLLFPPMERWKYSNLGYTVLGLVVERASGQPYTQFVGERILGPLALKDTTFDPAGLPPSRLATGHLLVPDQDSVIPDERAWRPISTAAGGLASTSADLARFASFMLGHGAAAAPLARPSLEEMLRPRLIADDGWTQAHGLGVMLVRQGNRIMAGHPGVTFSFAGWVLVSPGDQVGAVCLVNQGDDRPAFAVAARLVAEAAEWAARGQDQLLPAPDAMAGLLGRYVGDRGVVVSVSWRNGRLVAEWASRPGVPPGPQAEIEVTSDGVVRFVDGPYVGEDLQFEREPGGVVRGFQVCSYWYERVQAGTGASGAGW